MNVNNYLSRSTLGAVILFLLVLALPGPAHSTEEFEEDLRRAVRLRQTEDVLAHIGKGVNVNAKDENAWTALMYAVRGADAEMVKLLIRSGSNVNVRGSRGESAPMIALREKHAEILAILLDSGGDVHARYLDGGTLLMNATAMGRVDLMKLILSKGADINAKSDSGDTALTWALHREQFDAARSLIDNGADVNAKDLAGNTVLLKAASKGNTGVVDLLIRKGAKVNEQNTIGITPLMAAAGMWGAVRVMEEKITERTGKTPQHPPGPPGSSGNIEVVRLLLDGGAEVNTRADDGCTALMVAALGGETAIARLLIEKGAEVDCRYTNGRTPLMLAAYLGHIDIVRILIEKGADVKARSQDGSTAELHAQKHPEIIALLSQAGGITKPSPSPILDQNKRLTYAGFSVLPPPAKNWAFVDQNPTGVTFARWVPEKNRSVVVRAAITKVYDPTFKKDISGLKEFAERTWAMDPRVRDARFKNFVSRVARQACQKRDCVRFQFEFEDHGSPAAPGSVLSMVGYGYYFLHPDEKETYIIRMEYSQRFPKGKRALPVASEADAFFDSMVLIPMK